MAFTSKPSPEKKTAPMSLKEAMAAAEKYFRVEKGLSDIVFDPQRRIEFVETGWTMADLVLGGGWARGRLAEVFGQEGSCKTSLVLATCASLQKVGKVSILVDLEHSFNVEWARSAFGLEVDNETFSVFQPNNIDEADTLHMRFIENLQRLDFLSFDSVDTMRPKAQIEGALSEERRIGAHAQAMGRFVAKLNPFVHHRKIPAVFVNQMRHIIPQGGNVEQSVGTGAGFNLKETYTTTGGQALRYYARQRLKLEFGGRLKDAMGSDAITGVAAEQRVGQMVKCINVKNTVSTPYLKGTGHFYFKSPGQKAGWGNDADLIEILKSRGHIAQTAGNFAYTGLRQNWKHKGRKDESERKFAETEELISDARDLLRHLTADPARRQELVEVARAGRDFSETELQEMPRNQIRDLEQETGVAPVFDMDDADGISEVQVEPNHSESL